MIEVKERLNVSAKDFFSKIEESVIYDIEKSTGKKLVPRDIYNGFKYTKNLKNYFSGDYADHPFRSSHGIYDRTGGLWYTPSHWRGLQYASGYYL